MTMKASEAFELVKADTRDGWKLRPKSYSLRKLLRIRNYDALLSAETSPHDPDLLGSKVWQGDLRPVGRAVAGVVDALKRLSPRRRNDAIKYAFADIAAAEYGGSFGSTELERGAAGSLITGMPQRMEKEFDLSNEATPESIAAANRAFWSQQPELGSDDIYEGGSVPDVTSGPFRAHDHKLNTRATPQSIQRANDMFWANRTGRPAPRLTRDSARHVPGRPRVSVADIQRMNDQFWNSRAAENAAILPPRPWGKG
jgi:hypothetical protein